MILRSVKSVEPIEITHITYKGTKYPVRDTQARWLTHKDLGGEEYVHNHALRHFNIGPKGEIPLHQHQQVEIVFVLSGNLTCINVSKEGKRTETEVQPGDCIYHYSNEIHSFQNRSDTEPAAILCCVDCIGDKSNCIPTSNPKLSSKWRYGLKTVLGGYVSAEPP
jgi:quercetin dioxygenase-like cupin family protein